MDDDHARHHEAMTAKADRCAQADTVTPADRYRELFEAVQTARVFDDGKTFVDCAPKQKPERILEAYRARRNEPGFDLARFVHAHFAAPERHDSHYVSPPGQTLREHIDGLWDVLAREPQEHPADASLIALPEAYVVPGGRFRELYYWDSYFTMLGLAESGRSDLLRSMANNFAYLIDTYGHVPNGNRTYYLSRSQPPVFALMVQLFERHGIRRARRYLRQLRIEYAWWMEGADELGRGEAYRHCVRLDDGSVLNRYWDERDTPREEAFLEDVQTAARSRRPAAEVYRDLRAAAASGWDFSSRWCGDDGEGGLADIRTTRILPVDLNGLLHVLETQIALLSAAAGEEEDAASFRQRAQARQRAMDRYFWSETHGAFLDFDWERGRQREQLTGASVVPLFARVASRAQAHRLAATVRDRLLEHGGLVTTAVASGQQWDRPNGWAPLQWLAMHGFYDYGERRLAAELGRRWLDTVSSLYRRESKLVEKYVLVPTDQGAVGGDGGEYPLQDGFGWTNGVVRRMLRHDPQHRAHRAHAASSA